MATSQEILKKIEEHIMTTDLGDSFSKQGEILEVKDGVATVVGLENAIYFEIVSFANGTRGLVLDLLHDQVGVLIIGTQQGLAPGQVVKSTGKTFSVGVGPQYAGRVLDGVGNPIDKGADIKNPELYPVEIVAPRVIRRKSVDQPLQTGIKAIDSMVPIGRGQRELIIGDRQTGKTSVAIDTIINQKEENIHCIYVAIGQKESKVARIVETLREKGALSYTTIVNAPANAPAVMQYMSAYVGCAHGERYMNQGKDALIIYDDLSKHAIAYREMSLLLKRPPGREAFPGDVFYQHSKLLERAARLDTEFGGGSLTALPIIETQAGDVGAYIPTNVISITDGQIYLGSDLFNAGIRPAINVGLSVSRVGGAAQTGIMKKVSGSLRLDLAVYRELQAFAQFGSDLDPSTKRKLERGARMVEILKQNVYSPLNFAKQSALIYAGAKGYLDELSLEDIKTFETILFEKLDSSHKKTYDKIQEDKKLNDEVETLLKSAISSAINETKQKTIAKKK